MTTPYRIYVDNFHVFEYFFNDKNFFGILQLTIVENFSFEKGQFLFIIAITVVQSSGTGSAIRKRIAMNDR